MRVTVLAPHGAWWMARRLAAEGQTVRLWAPGGRGKGFVPTVATPVVADETELVVSDGPVAALLGARRRGIPTLGGGIEDSWWRTLRPEGWQSFSTRPVAEAFFATHPGDWRLNDRVVTASYGQRVAAHLPPPLVVWRATEQCRVGGLFTGKEFARPFFGSVGDHAQVSWVFRDDDPPIAQRTLGRLAVRLRAEQYHGPVTVTVTTHPIAVVGVSTTWPASWSAFLDPPLGPLLEALARGKMDRLPVRRDLVATMPALVDEPAGFPLPADVTRGAVVLERVADDGGPRVVAGSGAVVTLVATGRTLAGVQDGITRWADRCGVFPMAPLADPQPTWKELGAAPWMTMTGRRSGKDSDADTSPSTPAPAVTSVEDV